MTNLTIFKVYEATHEHQKLVDELSLTPLSEDSWAVLASSETSRNELLGALATLEFDDSALEEALAHQIEILQTRKARLTKRRANIRTSLKNIMEYGRLRKIETPTCTLSINKGGPKLKIESLTQLYIEAKEYFSHPPKLEKKLLMDDLKAGVVLTSATLTNEPSLVIRRK